MRIIPSPRQEAPQAPVAREFKSNKGDEWTTGRTQDQPIDTGIIPQHGYGWIVYGNPVKVDERIRVEWTGTRPMPWEYYVWEVIDPASNAAIEVHPMGKAACVRHYGYIHVRPNDKMLRAWRDLAFAIVRLGQC